MKALSIRQPYADFILYGPKGIETRPHNTSHRGKFLIHTSKQLDKAAIKFYNITKLIAPLGAIVGSAELIGVEIYKTQEQFRQDRDIHLCWWDPDITELPKYGYILNNCESFKITTPLRGQLGFFNVEINGGDSSE